MIVVCNKDRTYIAYSPLLILNGGENACVTEKDIYNEENLLFFKVKNKKNCIFAGRKKLKDFDALRYSENLFNFDKINTKTIMNNLIPNIKEVLLKYDYYDEKNQDFNDVYVLAIENKAFYIMEDFVYEIPKVESFGIDKNLAYPIFFRKDNLSIEQKLIELGKIIEQRNATKVFPIAVIDTKTKKINYLYENDFKKYKTKNN